MFSTSLSYNFCGLFKMNTLQIKAGSKRKCNILYSYETRTKFKFKSTLATSYTVKSTTMYKSIYKQLNQINDILTLSNKMKGYLKFKNSSFIF